MHSDNDDTLQRTLRTYDQRSNDIARQRQAIVNVATTTITQTVATTTTNWGQRPKVVDMSGPLKVAQVVRDNAPREGLGYRQIQILGNLPRPEGWRHMRQALNMGLIVNVGTDRYPRYVATQPVPAHANEQEVN